jgi:hypothetical protein
MARFFTTYDGAIYSMIVDLQTKTTPPPHLPCERFGKKNLRFFEEDEVGLKFARLSLISFGEKIRDDQLDKNHFKAKLGSLLFSKIINKAKEAEPNMANDSYQGTEKINKLQETNQPIMEIFAAYGDMAANSISHFIQMTKETEELVRSVSEWIFLVDMICDYDEDYKNGTYNGFKIEGIATFSEYFDTNYQEFLYSLDYAILSTNRFGTKIEYNQNGRIKLTDEFKEWYDSWQNYETNLDDATRKLYYTYRRQGKSLELFSLDKQLTSNDISNIVEENDSYYYKPIIKSIKQITA